MRERIARWLERISTWSLAGLLLALPFWRHRVLLHRPEEAVFFEFHDVTLYTTDLLWWAALGAWLLSRLVRRDPRTLRLGPWFIVGPLVGLLALSAAGIPFAVDPLHAGYQVGRLVLLLALYLLLVNLPLPAGAIAWPLAAGMSVQALVAVPQFALGHTLGLTRLGEVIENAAWPGASVVKVGPESWLRAYGFTQHPNLLGGCLMVMLLLTGGYYLTQRGRQRWPLLVALSLGCVALLLTFSRAAWLGTCLGSLVAVASLRGVRHREQPPAPRFTIGVLLACLAVLSAGFVATNWPLLRSRMGLVPEATEIESVEARKLQIPAAWALIQDHPVAGVGLGNYATALHRATQGTASHPPVYQPVFNVALLVTAELGVGGGCLWLALMVSPWIGLWRGRRRLDLDLWWAGLSGALLALALVSVFDFYVWTSHQGQILLWVTLGLWAREWEEQADHTRRAG